MNARHMLATAVAALFLTPAFAQTPATPKVDQRQANQAARIEQGKASGQLTDKEAARLEVGQAKVAAKEEKAKSDGVVTKKERAKLQHAENKQSRKIKRQKHDAQTKPAN
ncbi:MAG: hypothetical protein IPP88_00725 [Betaproteobacteria bacterium]|nr:hypothetical protein [Betaproteobacteria bacterium]